MLCILTVHVFFRIEFSAADAQSGVFKYRFEIFVKAPGQTDKIMYSNFSEAKTQVNQFDFKWINTIRKRNLISKKEVSNPPPVQIVEEIRKGFEDIFQYKALRGTCNSKIL